MRQIVENNPSKVVEISNLVFNIEKVYCFKTCGNIYKLTKLPNQLYTIVCISDTKMFWVEAKQDSNVLKVLRWVFDQGYDLEVFEFDSLREVVDFYRL